MKCPVNLTKCQCSLLTPWVHVFSPLRLSVRRIYRSSDMRPLRHISEQDYLSRIAMVHFSLAVYAILLRQRHTHSRWSCRTARVENVMFISHRHGVLFYTCFFLPCRYRARNMEQLTVTMIFKNMSYKWYSSCSELSSTNCKNNELKNLCKNDGLPANGLIE
jgi:hypothetical protein